MPVPFRRSVSPAVPTCRPNQLFRPTRSVVVAGMEASRAAWGPYSATGLLSTTGNDQLHLGGRHWRGNRVCSLLGFRLAGKCSQAHLSVWVWAGGVGVNQPAHRYVCADLSSSACSTQPEQDRPITSDGSDGRQSGTGAGVFCLQRDQTVACFSSGTFATSRGTLRSCTHDTMWLD